MPSGGGCICWWLRITRGAEGYTPGDPNCTLSSVAEGCDHQLPIRSLPVALEPDSSAYAGVDPVGHTGTVRWITIDASALRREHRALRLLWWLSISISSWTSSVMTSSTTPDLTSGLTCPGNRSSSLEINLKPLSAHHATRTRRI